MDTGWIALTILNLIIAVFALTKARQQGVKMSVGWMIVVFVSAFLATLGLFAFIMLSRPNDVAIYSLF
jgi:hypothetical protein